MKTLVRLLVLTSLAASFLAVAQVVPAPVVSAATNTSTFKLSTVEAESTPPGCVANCPTTKTQIPAYSPQSSVGSTLSDATVVRTIKGWNGPNMTDSAGCAIVSQGGLKCWGDNAYGQLGTGSISSNPSRVETPVAAMSGGSPLTGVTDVAATASQTCVVVGGDARCVGSGFEDPNNPGSWTYSAAWTTVQSNVSRIVLGTTWNSMFPLMCALTTTGRVKCGYMKSADGWVDAGYAGVTDIATLSVGTGLTICLAGEQSLCLTFDGLAFTVYSTMTNLAVSESVYVQTDMNSVLCFYDGDTTHCGPTTGGDTRLTPIGVMPQPLSIFGVSGMRVFFVLPNGLVFIEGWYFSCSNCAVQGNIQVTPVTAFTASTSTSYNFATDVLAKTDTANIIPMRVESGARNTRTLAAIKVVTSSGTPLNGTSVRWTAPDVPGTLGSSSTSTLTTDADGNARSTLATGPVTFTLTNGSAANGAQLHAASITVIVATSGTTVVTVPDAPAIINRRVTVLNADGSPVPNATVALRNVLLNYAYQSSGSSLSTWGSQGRDTRGFFNQVSCVHCHVVSPTYITGTDGSVSFRSFAPGTRSGTFDAAVIYDDGDLNQTVNTVFTSENSTVSMPFMAKVAVATADADPSTSVTEVELDASGKATIEVELSDESGLPVDGFSASTETVCNEMETGGLTSAATRVSSLCGGVVTSTSALTSGVSASGVSKACTPTASAVTGKNGKATFTFCATSSTKFRIRGKGALPSRTICVVAKGKACTVGAASAPSTSTGSTTAATKTVSVKRSKKTALTKLLKPAKKSTATYKVTRGKCRVSGAFLTTPNKKETCVLRMTQTTKTKVKGKWKVTKTQKSVRISVT